jgi:hypothetical protein
VEWIEARRGSTVGLDTGPLIYYMEEHPAFLARIKGPRKNNFTFGYLAPWRRHSCLPRPDSSGRLPDVHQSASR